MRMLRISPPIRMILYSSDDLKQMSFNRLKSVIRHLIGVLCEQDKKDILNWAKASWKSDINVDDVSTPTCAAREGFCACRWRARGKVAHVWIEFARRKRALRFV